MNGFAQDLFQVPCEQLVQTITRTLQAFLREQLKRTGYVVALSGGIDSSVAAALCVRAVGKDRVFGLLMPERDSSADTVRLSRLIAEHLKIDYAEENITPVLEALGCYERRNRAVREVIPEFGEDWKCKLLLPSILNHKAGFRIFSVQVQSPKGECRQARLTPAAYRGIVAATNFKQRVRKMLEYYHADRLHYAVAGTPNRLEYDQGFFVKGGDGLADVKPIAHLYKTQVYALGRYLGIPEEICSRPPTTDTYSMPQSQEEFYFSLPYDKMDLCLYAYNRRIAPEEAAPTIGLTAEQVQRVYEDIEQKRKTTRYLHLPPLLVESVFEELK
ncbi:MAG: NAD(+) synthase [Anaerohalosphaeraceae bacterium]